MNSPRTRVINPEHSDAELWDACLSVITSERAPLELWRVATAARLSEAQVVAALIRESAPRRTSVTFRFPPLPCAAITAMGNIVAQGPRPAATASAAAGEGTRNI